MNHPSAKEVVELLGRFLNRLDETDVAEFVQEVARLHRTLQQQLFEVIIKCIANWAKMHAEDYFDPRNEYTVTTSTKIMAAIKEVWFGRVPMI